MRIVGVLIGLLLALLLAGLGYELSLPSVTNAPFLVAEVVHAHGGKIGELPLPKKLAEAEVAVEDEHFYANAFVNVFDGAARAALTSLHSRGDPGRSTIAQQLAKQIYPSGSGFGGTLEQVGLGLKLSLTYSKDQVLEMYLNAIYYGNGYWGYLNAARGYFGVDPGKLDWSEASMLAGLPQAPSDYDPVRHFALAKQRQRQVLDQLVANHALSAARAAAAYRAPFPSIAEQTRPWHLGEAAWRGRGLQLPPELANSAQTRHGAQAGGMDLGEVEDVAGVVGTLDLGQPGEIRAPIGVLPIGQSRVGVIAVSAARYIRSHRDPGRLDPLTVRRHHRRW